MSYLDEAFKDLHELEDGVDLQDEQEVKDAIAFMNGDEDNLAQLELIVDADADSEEDIKDTYVGELLLYCPVCHTIHYEKEENIVFDEENDEIVNVGDACPHCKQENGYEIVGKVEEYDATEDDTDKEDKEPTEDDDVPLELDDIEDFEDEETTKKVEESFKIRKRLKEHFEEDNLEELARFTGERLHTRERVRETKKVEPKKVEPKQSLKESKTPKKALKESDEQIYIYQLPKDANVNYIRQNIGLTSANSIKLVGKVNRKGDQPGDILISGTKEDLAKFVDDYFDLQLLDDYLYEEDEFDTDLITPLKVKESKLVEKPVYGLEPRYDARKSFYGKARVDTGDKGDKNKLYSYDTLVAEIKDGKPVVYGTYSQTTLRHIKEWLKQLGFKAENSKQILADYGAKKESCKEAKKTIQRVKEGYYDYMDKDYAHILDSDVDVYDVNAYILKDSDNKFKAHYTDEYAIIVAPNGKGCVVDYEAVGQDFDSVDSKIDFGAVENKDGEYTDEKGNKYKTFSIIATHRLTTTPKEIMENAPKKTMKYKDFFKKYKYNDRCASNFRELVSYLQSNGAFKGEKVTESKKRLNEGPGAGYSVKGKVTNVHNVQVVSDVESESEYYSNTLMATAECDIVGVSASSYDFGREIVGGSPIPAKLEIKLDYDKDEFNNGATQVVEALGDDFEFDAGIGGGWSHVTFNGVIEGDYHDVENSPYSIDILNFTIKIENENVIKDIDKAVTGEDWIDNYDVIDTDGDIVDSFETEEEAIDYAKDNRGVAVEHRQYQYALLDDFESEDIIDEYSDGTVWEREYTKSYKYDDEEPQEEALDTKKVPPVITDEQKACKDEECKKKELDESLIVTCDFDDYKPWSGAIDTYDRIEEEGKLGDLENLLEECYPEGISMVGINDILWFDWEWVFEELGITDGDDEEETEDEEDFDESLFESLVDRYCQRVYDNVRDFKTTSCSKKEKNFVVEGILHYTNGKKAKTTFTFKEAKAPNGKRKFVGLNETFSKDNKAFTLLVSTGDKKLLSESLSYKYNVEYKGEQKEIKGKIVTPKH